MTCLLWQGATNGRAGYGVARVDGKAVLAHRLAYEQAYGPIPPGMDVCHHCDTPLCVEPTHLFVGTRRDNMEDARRKGRWHPEGHSYPGERNGNAKLSEEDVRAIRAEPGTHTSKARKYGVSIAHISRIMRGMNWTGDVKEKRD